MFTARVLDHCQRPRNLGPIEGAAVGESGIEGDGPYIKIWVRLEGDLIAQAAYKTYGCPASIACSSQLVELVSGKSQEYTELIEPKDLILLLGGLPEGKEHCANMAVEALKQALENARAESDLL